MISNQVLQNTISGLADITKVDFSVIDSEGNLIANTASLDDKALDAAKDFLSSDVESQVVAGCNFFKVYDSGVIEYVLVAMNDNEAAALAGKICAFQLKELLVAYKERFDKDNFFKNLLLDNLLLVDIYNRSKKLHIKIDDRRVVMIVKVEGEKEGSELEVVRSVFSGKPDDFVTAVDENNIIVIKSLGEKGTVEDVEKTAKVIVDAFKDGKNKNIRISYGTVVTEIKDVSRSYKEAGMALDVGKIFFDDKQIIAYSVLGIGRLIYQLPIPLCKMFISEIFDGKTPDQFDEETLTTINKFFENSLNVSETSRQLYIHRNTLVYRLDKLQKSTGLDLRVFEDAITFKIALMVVKYMKYMESQEF